MVRLIVGCCMALFVAAAGSLPLTQATAAQAMPQSRSPEPEWHHIHMLMSARDGLSWPCKSLADSFGYEPDGYCPGGFQNVSGATPPFNSSDVGARLYWDRPGGDRVDVTLDAGATGRLRGYLPNRGSGDLHILEGTVPAWGTLTPITSGDDASKRGKPGGPVNFDARWFDVFTGHVGYEFTLDGYVDYGTATPPKLRCQLSSAEVGKRYRNQWCLQEGGPPTPKTERIDGQIPPGISMEALQGTAEFSGYPSAGGRYPFVLKSSNGVAPDFIAPVSITVNPAPTNIETSAEPKDRSLFGQPVTLTAVVSHAFAAAIPTTATGTVRFYEGKTPICSGELGGSGGGKSKATCTAHGLRAGDHSIKATYVGDASFDPSTSSHLAHTVDKNHSTTAVSSTDNPSVLGHPVVFTGTVKPQGPHSGTPGGKLQFAVDGRDLGPPVELDNGSAKSVPTSTLTLGKHTVTASYEGNEAFHSSKGELAGEQKVGPRPTTTSVSSPVSPVSGQGVRFTAKVAPSETGVSATPTGDIQFFVDKRPIGEPVQLTNGAASSPETKLTAGTYSVTAHYAGKDEFAESVGELPGGLVVGRASTSVTLSSSQNPSTARTPVTFTATVKAQPPGSGTPGGGNVQFFVDGQPFGPPVQVKDGSARSEPDSSLEAGNHVVTAFYGGHTDFLSASAPPFTQKVRPR